MLLHSKLLQGGDLELLQFPQTFEAKLFASPGQKPMYSLMILQKAQFIKSVRWTASEKRTA